MSYGVILSPMRTTRVVSITLPPALFEQAKALAKAENRTMSELLREALRSYQREQKLNRIASFGKMRAEMAGVQTEEDVVRLVREVRREIYEEEQAHAQSRTGTQV